MTSDKDRRRATIRAALEGRCRTLEGLPLPNSLGDDAMTIVRAYAQMRDYRGFLAAGRAAKAKGGQDIDRLVLSEARATSPAVDEGAAAAGRVLRTLHLTGAFAQITAGLAEIVEQTGPLDAQELLSELTHFENRAQLLETAGISDDLIKDFETAYKDVDLVASIKRGRLRIKDAKGSVDMTVPLDVDPASPSLPTDAADLLSREHFVGVCDLLDGGEPAYLAGTEPIEGDLGRAVLADVLASQREWVRHVRKLEDAGLATYAGADPATVLFLFALSFIIGIALIKSYCLGDDQPNGAKGDLLCALGALMTFFTALLFLGGAQKNNNVSTTGQTLSGPLQQLTVKGRAR